MAFWLFGSLSFSRYSLTPAGPAHAEDDDDGNALLPDSVGIAINGNEAKVDTDGTIPSTTLAPKMVACSPSGSVRVELAALTGAFVVFQQV